MPIAKTGQRKAVTANPEMQSEFCHAPLILTRRKVMEIKFGDSIVITKIFIRFLEVRSEYKYWKEIEIQATRAIFLGNRTLKNGCRNYDSDEGYTFEPREQVPAMLVCFNQYSNPVYAPRLTQQEKPWKKELHLK